MILIAGAGVFAALKASRPEPPPVRAEERTWVVAIETVSPANLSPTLTLYGRVESPHTATLTAAVTADVDSVQVREGERVTAGTVLISLDERESRFILSQREAEVSEIEAMIASERLRYQTDRTALGQEQRLLELNTKAVQRARDLAKTNVGSQSQLDQALQDEARQVLSLESRKLAIREFDTRIAQLESRLEKAVALRELAHLDVSRTTVRSPFDGRVARVFVSPGDRVRSADPLLRVFDTSAVEIRAQIPNRHLPAVRTSIANRQALAAEASVDGRTVRAVLDRLGSEISAGRGGVDAIFEIFEEGDWLQLGRTLEMTVTLPPAVGVVALPSSAVYGTDRVYKLENDRMVAVQIERRGELREPGRQTRVLVAAPELGDGDQVIVTQLPNAIDGLKVRVAPD